MSSWDMLHFNKYKYLIAIIIIKPNMFVTTKIVDIIIIYLTLACS